MFLLAGAVVNVAVAWGCAVWIAVGREREVTASRYTDTNRVHVGRWSRSGASIMYADRVRAAYGFSRVDGAPEKLLPDWSGLGTARAAYESGAVDEEYRVVDMRGWPMLTLWSEGELVRTRVAGVLKQKLHVRGGLVTSLGVKGHFLRNVLPLRPLWPGFAVNTLFYAGILWLAIPGPFALRRLIRRRRGLCPKCAYPMGESAVCSECGKELPKRVRPAT